MCLRGWLFDNSPIVPGSSGVAKALVNLQQALLPTHLTPGSSDGVITLQGNFKDMCINQLPGNIVCIGKSQGSWKNVCACIVHSNQTNNWGGWTESQRNWSVPHVLDKLHMATCSENEDTMAFM